MKKALYLSLVLILAVSFLSACGSGNQENKASPKETAASPSSSPSASASESPSESKADTPPRKVELKVFMSFPRFKDQFESYFEQFKAKELAEKNIDVSIKLEMPNPDQAKQILQTRLASNDAPDLFTLHAIADIPTYYKAGYLSDLSDQPFVPKVYESVRKTVTFDGKVVALPLESLSWGYLYNKKIFADAGIAPPQTLDEMKAAIEKLNGS
jgi:raffinose/stachyose/melibiose transport system substrate-binding protein